MLDLEWDNLDEAFRGLESECEQVVRGFTVEIWNGVLAKTPQYYGRMVASWTYSIGAPVFEDRSGSVVGGSPEDFDRGPLQAFWRGHREAIDVANSHSAGRDRGFRLGDTVWLANGVDHGEGPYSAAIENGEINLRLMNRPGTPVGRTLDWARVHYGDGIPVRKAEKLRTLTIGGQGAADGDS